MRTSTIILLILIIVVLIGGSLLYVTNYSLRSPSTGPTNNINETQSNVSSADGTVSTTTPPNTTASVNIKNFAFDPATVRVRTGATVTWTNNDAAPHTVTSVSGNTINSPTLTTGQSFSMTFTEKGTYLYRCSIHPNMRGTIIVQ